MKPLLLLIVLLWPCRTWAQWAPTIDHLEMDDVHNRLTIFGSFGDHGGAVYFDSTLVKCIDWQPDSLVCELPPSKGSCGPVQVFTTKGPTEERILSSWGISGSKSFMHNYSDGGQDFYGWSVSGRWRLDLKFVVGKYHEGNAPVHVCTVQNERWSGGQKGFRGGGGLYPEFDTAYTAEGRVSFDPELRSGFYASQEGEIDFAMDERFGIIAQHVQPYPYGTEVFGAASFIPSDSDLFARSYRFSVPVSLNAVLSGLFVRTIDTFTTREDSIFLVDTLIHHESTGDSAVKVSLAFTNDAVVSRIDGHTHVSQLSGANYPNRADLSFTLDPDSSRIRDLTLQLFQYQPADTLELTANYRDVPYSVDHAHLLINHGALSGSPRSASFHHSTRRYRATDVYLYGQTLISVKDSAVNHLFVDMSPAVLPLLVRNDAQTSSPSSLIYGGSILVKNDLAGSIARVFDSSGKLESEARVSSDRTIALDPKPCSGLYFVTVGPHLYKLLVP